MSSFLQSILKPLASLRLTVVLLALSMLLIFAGTWAQLDQDVWAVQKRYFHTFFTWIPLQLFLPRDAVPADSGWKPIVESLRPLRFPMLGGYALIALLLTNLLSAHTLRFKYTIKRAGIVLIHGGIILLILGEVVTSQLAVEGQMRITEGQTASFTEDVRAIELAVTDPSPADHDAVTVIPASRLAKQDRITYPTLPFEIRVDRYYPNSVVLGPAQARQQNVTGDALATHGSARSAVVVARPSFGGAGADASRVNAPSAFVTPVSRDGVELGTYLVSLFVDEPQAVEVDGRVYHLDLRFVRSYKSYSLTLIDFSHDRYTGTNTPRNFSSRVRLRDPSRGEDREVLIWMNHPLRYAGETFYQSGFDERDERTTILQVVRNPGWLIPYVSCILVGAGMLVHFGAMLLKFLDKVRDPTTLTPASESAKTRIPSAPGSKTSFSTKPQQYVLKPRGGVLVPLLVTALCFLYLLSAGRPPKLDSPFDFNAFARIPISYEGRVLPLDTLARVSLRVLSGKSELRTEQGKLPAIRWLADVFAKPEAAEKYKVFRVDHPDLKSLLGLGANEKMFSHEQVMARVTELNEQWQRATRVPAKEQNAFQKSVIDLAKHVQLFQRLAGIQTLYLAPPTTSGGEWKQAGEAASEAQASGTLNPGVRAFVDLTQAYHTDQPARFNATAGDYLAYLKTHLKKEARKAAFEVMFNHFEPFVKSIYLYVLVFLLTCAAWVVAPARATLLRTAFWVLLLTFAFHTLGLVARIYIQGRPPVTNLYSSAIFIGWAAVGLCAAIEWIFRNGIGSLTAAMVAFPTLIIAHYLAGSGDTMQMLQAVLDTNIWLATHVVVITMGYSAMFLAGGLGILYVIRMMIGWVEAPTSWLGRSIAAVTFGISGVIHLKTLAQITYGIVCFAMLFSFVGTVLGGIWADQSWGRFWGWDPKENGAALIVLWNAILLHARWGGVVRERGFMLLAIFGNVITAWSWFGTNMMGVGFHSYGFMDSGVFWLGLFVATQLFLIGLGNLPQRAWRSFASNGVAS